MEPDSREEKEGLAFIDQLVTGAGYELRQPDFMTLQRIALLELDFGKSAEGVDKDRMSDHVNAYLFIQAAPLPLVSRVIRGFRMALRSKSREEAYEELFCEHIEPWLSRLTPEAKAGLEAGLEQLSEVEELSVIAEPPPGNRSREADDPNS